VRGLLGGRLDGWMNQFKDGLINKLSDSKISTGYSFTQETLKKIAIDLCHLDE
jgi:hypothetical protein